MSITNRAKLNRLIDTVSGLPLVHGDYYRPADRIIDIIHSEGFTGDVLSEVLTYPSIISGLVVTINANSTTLDITAGEAIGVDSQNISITEHNYDGVPLSGLDVSTGYTHPVNNNSGLATVPRFIEVSTGLTAQSTALVPNGGSGFVKLRYKDEDLFTRNTPSDPTATAYSFLTRDSYEIIIDTIAPTVADVCLGEFTKDAFGAIISLTFVNREVDTGIQLKNNTMDLTGGNRLKLNDANLTANRIYTLQNRNMTIAGTDDITKLYITASAAIGIGAVVTITGDDAVNTRPQAATLTTAFQVPVGIAEAATANGAGGYITIAGRVATTLNAATASVGDPVYATSTGALSLTRTMWKIGVVATNTANAVIYCNFDFTEDLYTDGSVSAPAISFENDPDTGLYRIGANIMGFAANGARQGQFGVGYGGFTGNVIQVQSVTKSDVFTSASTSFVDITGLSVNITPFYSNSRIYIICNILGVSTVANIGAFQLVRDSTPILLGDIDSNRTRTSAAFSNSAQGNVDISTTMITGIDTPNKTTITNYKIQGRTSAGNLHINRTTADLDVANYPRTVSTITVMEIQQ